MKWIKLFTLTVSLVYCLPLNAQNPSWQWAKGAGGGTYDDIGKSVSVDLAGNTYVSGSFNDPSITLGTFTLNNAPGSGNNSNIFIAKYDNSGNVLWAKSAGGLPDDESYNIAVDTNGNSYITGFFSSDSITFDSFTLHSTSTYNIFLVKYDNNGNVIWAKSANGTSHDYGNCIAVDAQYNVYLTGYFNSNTLTFDNITINGSGGYNCLFVAKFDSSGHAIWAFSNATGGSSAYANGITCDTKSNFYLTGTFSGTTMNFGGTTLFNSLGQDIFIAKYDSAGTVLWVNSGGGSGYDNVNSIAVDADGNSFITGNISSNAITFDSIANNFGGITLSKVGGTDIFIAKYDSTGVLIWAKGVGGANDDISNSISTDPDGNAYITGAFYFTNITFGTTTLINTGISNIFVAAFDPLGNNIWATKVGGSNQDIGYGIAVDNYGNASVTGAYGSTSIAFGSHILNNTITSNIFTAKMSIVTGINVNTNYEGNGMGVYPNPASTSFNIALDKKYKKANLIITDINGKIIYDHSDDNSQLLEVNISDFSQGLYFVKIQTPDFIKITKLLINR